MKYPNTGLRVCRAGHFTTIWGHSARIWCHCGLSLLRPSDEAEAAYILGGLVALLELFLEDEDAVYRKPLPEGPQNALDAAEEIRAELLRLKAERGTEGE